MKKREAFYSQEDPLSFSKEILKSSLPGLDARKKTLETVLAQDNLSDAQRDYLEKDLEMLFKIEEWLENYKNKGFFSLIWVKV